MITHLRLLSLAIALGAVAPLAAAEPTALFNGRNLDGWMPYAKDPSPPAGETWTATDGVIHCTGKPPGYLRTTSRHRNYRLAVEWRWVPVPAPADAQGKPRSRNSGVLLHMQGEDALWPKSIEAQLMETRAGDIYAIGGVDTAEHQAARNQAIAAAGNDEQELKRARNLRRLPRRKDSSEKANGDWNRYEIVCRGDTVVLTVNGVEQNRVTGVSVAEGHICLQSEGAPIEFRNIVLTPLD